MTLCAGTTIQTASAGVYAWRGDSTSDSDRIFVGANWYDVTNKQDVTNASSDKTWYPDNWVYDDGNIMLFDADSTTDNTTLVNCFEDLGFDGIVVNSDAAASEYTIRSNNKNADRDIHFYSTSASDITTVGNNTMDEGATNIIVAANKTLNIAGGEYSYRNANLNNDMNIVVGSNAAFSLKATTYVTNSAGYSTFISGGGTFTLDVTAISGDGEFVLKGSTLQIESLANFSNTLKVTGSSTLASTGTLALSGEIIFTQAGSSLDIDGDNISLGEGFSISIYENALFGDGITLTGLAGLEGDIDINILDANGNIIEAPDFTTSFTVDSNGNYTLNIIPEPTTATLSLLALAGLMARRRRNH